MSFDKDSIERLFQKNFSKAAKDIFEEANNLADKHKLEGEDRAVLIGFCMIGRAVGLAFRDIYGMKSKQPSGGGEMTREEPQDLGGRVKDDFPFIVGDYATLKNNKFVPTALKPMVVKRSASELANAIVLIPEDINNVYIWTGEAFVPKWNTPGSKHSRDVCGMKSKQPSGE